MEALAYWQEGLNTRMMSYLAASLYLTNMPFVLDAILVYMLKRIVELRSVKGYLF